MLVERLETAAAVAKDGVAIRHQCVDYLKRRAALVAGGFAVQTVLDTTEEGEQARAVAIGVVELVPEVA
jgi:hypothetical protein